MNKNYLTLTSILLLSLMLSSCSTALAALPKPVANLVTAAEMASAQATTAPVAGFTNTEPVQVQPGFLAAYEGTLENIYAQVSPQVVNIRVVQKQTVSSEALPNLPDIPFFGFPGIPNIPQNPGSQEPQYQQGLGSGFVWDKGGNIVTNNHVVDGADKIEVTFSDGSAAPAKLVGADPDSDLAVVKVDVAAEKLQPVQLADSNQVKVGQMAIAIGNPFGLEGTMTVGIVSAMGRTLPAGESDQTSPTYSIPDIIQTDAPINPGNSGGVLVNDQGQVIGVTSAIESPVRANAGIGFAIPSAIVQRVVPALIKTGSYDHPYLGISGIALSPDLAKAMDLSPDQRGALVAEVVPNGPADKAGIRGSDRQVKIDGRDALVGGDVIVAIDKQPIQEMDDLIAYLSDQTEVGQKVTLTVLRDGKENTLEVTLTARPSQEAQTTQEKGETSSSAWLGILGTTLTPDISKTMGLPTDQTGILVQRVEASSPADQAGLRGSYKPVEINGQSTLIGGDIITGVDGKAVMNADNLKAFLGQAHAGQEIILTILRDQEKMELQVKLGERPG